METYFVKNMWFFIACGNLKFNVQWINGEIGKQKSKTSQEINI